MSAIKKTENSYINDLRSKLENDIQMNSKTQSQVAKQLGVSKATLSLFLSGNYTGNNEEMAEKVEQYLALVAFRQSIAKEPAVCLTLSNTEQILEKVHITHATNDILLLYGSAGCGKTTALKYYTEHNNGAVYVEADVTTNSHRSILSLILEALGEAPKGATSDIMRKLVSKLKSTDKLIIIDEAQHLTPKSFDAIRALNDKAHVGIVYSGNPSILNRMYGRSAEELDQVHSRIGYQCPLKNRYSLNDIEKVFEKYHLPADCLQYLQRVSQRKGGLRVMVKQYKLAANIATALNEAFRIEFLDEAAKRMGI